MSTPTTRHDDPTETLYPIGGGSAKARQWIAAGIGLVIVSVIGFIATAISQLGQLQLQIMSTLPMVAAVGSFAKAWSIRRQPTQMSIGENGLTLDRLGTREHYGWDQIGWASIDMSPVGQLRRLSLYDQRGGKVAAIADSFSGFDAAAESVKARVASRHGEKSEPIRMRKARRSAVITTLISSLLLLVVFGNVWLAYRDQRANSLLETNGVRGEAKVLSFFIAPNGITRRVEYEVTGDNQQTGKRSVEVAREFWDAMNRVEKVAVIYVPSEPDISRLVNGEVAKKGILDNPKARYALSGILGLMCLLFLGAAVMAWKGWDLDLDSQTGKVSFKPFGTGK